MHLFRETFAKLRNCVLKLSGYMNGKKYMKMFFIVSQFICRNVFVCSCDYHSTVKSHFIEYRLYNLRNFSIKELYFKSECMVFYSNNMN